MTGGLPFFLHICLPVSHCLPAADLKELLSSSLGANVRKTASLLLLRLAFVLQSEAFTAMPSFKVSFNKGVFKCPFYNEGSNKGNRKSHPAAVT